MSPVSPARLAQSPPPGPGVWVTLGLGFVVLALFVATQLGCLIVLTTHTIGRVAGSEIEPEGLSEALAQTGLYLSFGGTTSALVATLAVVFIVAARKDTTIALELALSRVRHLVIAKWVGLALLFAALLWLLGWWVGRPPVSAPVVVAYQTARGLGWLWFTAVVMAAPLFEEFYFRGFLLSGLMRSRLGSSGAVLATSIVWSAIHLQYESFELGALLIFGVVLGWARVATGSIIPCLVMHAAFNAVSLATCAYYL